MRSSPRIFIGLREVAGYYGRLHRGFREAGVHSVFMNLGGNCFEYGEGINPAWVRFFNAIGHHIGQYFSKNFFLRILWLVFFQLPFSFLAFHIALFVCDVFIMGSNSTFMLFAELPILKLFRKKIIYVFLGTDSRPVYLNGYVMQNGDRVLRMRILTHVQKLVIRIIEHFADVVVNHPPQAHYHRKPFINLLCLGIPTELPSTMPKPESKKGPVNILHAPSKAIPKGSSVFQEMIERLKEKGHDIEYVEISGLTNKEVMQKIAACDFVLDEVYSDTPMAVFSAEAGSFSKPAVVGGYYAEYVKQDIPTACIPPSMFCRPDELERDIERMITDQSHRESLGKQAGEYIRREWNLQRVAEKYLMLIKGTAPAEWSYNPEQLTYPNGCGLHEVSARENIRAMLGKTGAGALGLRHNKKLEELIINFANKPQGS